MTVSEWLRDNIDSHGIYDITLLDELPAPAAYNAVTDELVAPGGRVRLGSRTAKTMQARESAEVTGNPKGAYLDPATPGSARLFGGFELAAALDRLLTGEDGGGAYFGRGTAFRARVAHLANAGY